MASREYSFLDIVVLDEVRSHFATGNAVAILTTDLEEVIWVNGPGAILFGHDDVEQVIGASAQLPPTLRRQIMAVQGYPDLGRDRRIAVRLTSGMTSQMVTIQASRLLLPGGEAAILLAVPAANDGFSAEKTARRAISGFRTAGHHAALIDNQGRMLAASQGFPAPAPDELAALVDEIRGAPNRLVKRLVQTGNTRLPAGMARLIDEPLLALLLIVGDTSGEATVPESIPGATHTIEQETSQAAAKINLETLPESPEIHGAQTMSISTGTAAKEAQQDEEASEPVRFVWRTDAQGRFSTISEEFRQLVGVSADIIGYKFSDVAAALGIDPDREIEGLLNRHDTWSGRCVLWPVAGTDILIPVDLAALPAYGRNREFEGFRGFGIARPVEAVNNPEGVRTYFIKDNHRSDEQTGQADPFDGETGQTAEAHGSKVVRLAGHRTGGASRSLTEAERSAFREIGARLKRESQRFGNEGGTALQGPTRETTDSDKEDRTRQLQQKWDAVLRPKLGQDRETGHSDDSKKDENALSRGMQSQPAIDTSILDRLPVALLIHSGDIMHYANRDFLEFTAYGSIDELAERGGLDALFGEPYRDEMDGERNDRKLRLRRADGLELPVEARLQSVPWKGGKALLLALRKVGRMPVLSPVAGFSIEQKVELEARIAELATIIDTATDGVVLIANDGLIRSISRPAEALFNIDSAEIAGKPFASLFAIESQRAARDYLNGLSENGVASVLNDGREVIGRESKGRFIPLFMTIGKLPNLGGYCAVLRDITHWKRVEEELNRSRAQAERTSSQKSDFLARVSHEIRTPLNAIIGFSELMMDEKFGPIGNDRYRDYLRDINRSGNHVLDLVNDLLDISKIEAGEQEMAREAISLNDMLVETLGMMQPQANRNRVIVRSSLASSLPEIMADRRSVRQIALNLLSNAIRYTQAGGQVIVSTTLEASGEVVMRVRDTGIGMTVAEIEQALKPFKQVNAPGRSRGDGTGLGLPLTKAMVEANRASFAISSTPGEGTLVEITFSPSCVLAG